MPFPRVDMRFAHKKLRLAAELVFRLRQIGGVGPWILPRRCFLYCDNVLTMTCRRSCVTASMRPAREGAGDIA